MNEQKKTARSGEAGDTDRSVNALDKDRLDMDEINRVSGGVDAEFHHSSNNKPHAGGCKCK